MVLTHADVSEIGKIVDEKIDAKINNLPTKDEFFEQLDQVMGELKNIYESSSS